MKITSTSFAIALLCLQLTLTFPTGLQASEDRVEADQPVSKALEEIGKTPWFDPESNVLVPVELSDKQSESAHRSSRWLPKAKKIAKPSAPSSSISNGWFNTGLTTANIIGWSILTAAFAALVAVVLYAFAKINPDSAIATNRKSTTETQGLSAQTLKKMQELPAELRRSDVDLRSEAERLMNQGNYDEAIKCLFGHQLLLLDQCGFLRLTRGKTNGRYLSETRKSKSDAAILLQATVATFEASYFGRHTPTAPVFQSLWIGNQRLESVAKNDLMVTR